MNILLFDGPERDQLLPFTFIRPVAHLRIGIDRLQDKWEAFLGVKCGQYTQDYLQPKFPTETAKENLFINPAYIPNQALADKVKTLTLNDALTVDGNILACLTESTLLPEVNSSINCIEVEFSLIHIKTAADLFLNNAAVLALDFKRLTKGKKSAPISSSNQLIAPENIFLEEGAKVECAILNATEGPIYIGKNAEVMEGSMLRGSIALCEQAVVKMGTKIYNGTTLGPYTKAAGELNNVLILGYSNKGHDGFLGNAVIGEWCNIGAASDASNLKNNYGKIRVWNYQTENFAKTDLQFCGLLMGDYSRCSIHSIFNTATVVGVCANLFGTGFPRTFLPSFSYGGAQGLKTYAFEKAMESNAAMMQRRKIALTQIDRDILENIYDLTAKWRKD
jgi:UDP-N-acetylglucosamine diphosphorylase/glucosamine-1-phosphate N-acetyltransferase